MKADFLVTVDSLNVIKEIEGAWSDKAMASILEELEIDIESDSSKDDLRELTIMALQDLKPQDAAKLLLNLRLGDVLSAGQIQNYAAEMLDEKLWEESSDMSLHERMFQVGSLLYLVAPGTFPEPDAVTVELTVNALNDPARTILRGTMNESFLARLISDGMEKNAALHRMFDDQLASGVFKEAENILWIVKIQNESPEKAKINITGSGLWLDALRGTEKFSSLAQLDAI